jgi:phosphatidylserine decarboxylase
VERPGSQVAIAPSKYDPDTSLVDDQELGNVNGIEYSLNQLIGGTSTPGTETPTTEGAEETGAIVDAGGPLKKFGAQIDASVVEPEQDIQETRVCDASVAQEMGVKAVEGEKVRSTSGTTVKPGNTLFFSVTSHLGIITVSIVLQRRL